MQWVAVKLRCLRCTNPNPALLSMNSVLLTRACKHKQLSRETQNVAVHGMGWWRKMLAPLGSDSGHAVRVNGSTWQWQSVGAQHVSPHKPWNHEQGPSKPDQKYTFFFVLIFMTLSCTQRHRFGLFAKTTRENTVFWLFFKQIRNTEILSQPTKWVGVLSNHEAADKITGAGNTWSYGRFHSITSGWTSLAGPELIPACSVELNACTKHWEKGEKLGKLALLVSEIHQGKANFGKVVGLIKNAHIKIAKRNEMWSKVTPFSSNHSSDSQPYHLSFPLSFFHVSFTNKRLFVYQLHNCWKIARKKKR